VINIFQRDLGALASRKGHAARAGLGYINCGYGIDEDSSIQNKFEFTLAYNSQINRGFA
jgi:hypothetical protein